MERRPGLAPGKNWFASSRLDGFGMRRMDKVEPPAGIAPASIPFRRRVPDLFEPRGRKLVRQPGVAPGRPLWKSGMLSEDGETDGIRTRSGRFTACNAN